MPMRTGLRGPKEAPNAYKTVEGDCEGKAVKSPCKKGFRWARLGEAKDEEPYRRNRGSLRIRGKRGSQTGTTCEAPSLELKAWRFFFF